MNKILRSLFASILCLMAMVTMTFSQSLQVIGSFPKMDGGFEAQTVGTVTRIVNLNDSVSTQWLVNNVTIASIVSGGARTGSQYATYNWGSGSGGHPLISPTADSATILGGVKYIVQYYYRTATATNASGMTVAISACGTGATSNITNKPTADMGGGAGVLLGTSGAWQMRADTITMGVPVFPQHLGYGIAAIRGNAATGTTLNIDDFVMYVGPTADVTAPDPASAPIATPIAGGTQMQLDWTVPGTGVDGGGYMIVRGIADPATTPNANGIYAVGNTVNTGEQVVYLGTANTFTDAGLSASTPYYYRIYTVDKAFNYSSSVSVNASTTVLPIEMASFTATMNGTSALLKWNTVTEINNMGFEIERKPLTSNLNSQISNPQWQKIGFVAGNGTSTRPKDYLFTDHNLAPGIYMYRIKQIDKDGTFKYTASTQVDAGVASKKFELLGNYPNPFNPATEIRFSVPEDGFASLKVYNMLGQVVTTLFEGIAKSGHYVSVTFNASAMASGVYFSRLEYNGKNMVQRMLLAK